MYTPWGRPQHRETILPGIDFVSTASHGGLVLSDDRLSSMPKVLRRGEGRFFEEDCAWSLVALAFLDEWLAADKTTEAAIRQCAKNWYPAAYEAFTGETIPPGESLKKDRQRFEARTKDEWVVISASSDGPNMVKVTATLGGKRGHTEERRTFLVPTDEYATCDIVRSSFIVNPNVHKEI